MYILDIRSKLMYGIYLVKHCSVYYLSVKIDLATTVYQESLAVGKFGELTLIEHLAKESSAN